MARYRSKPVEIEAVQFTDKGTHPAVESAFTPPGRPAAYTVHSRQGWVNVDIGDWIIAESDGSGYYPCKPDVFEAKYEKVN